MHILRYDEEYNVCGHVECLIPLTCVIVVCWCVKSAPVMKDYVLSVATYVSFVVFNSTLWI